jgi:hypothetical protein
MGITNAKDNQLLRAEYIIKKLFNTMQAFGELFPELIPIRKKLLLLPVLHQK